MPACVFSIIVPVYNTAPEYVKVCLDSLTAQTFPDIEILLVDDGSREELAEQYRALAAEDERITLLRQENAGVSAARNKGLKAAKGEWVWFVDADDWVELNACERAFSLLKESPVDMLLFNALHEYSGMTKQSCHGFESGQTVSLDNLEAKEALYRAAMRPPKEDHASITYCWDKLFRRSFLLTNSLFFMEGLFKSEDKLFFTGCVEKLSAFLYTQEAFYHYRRNLESVCHRYSAHADRERVFLYNELLPVAKRMNRELSERKGTPYKAIEHDLERFMFGIISDVLLLKYYHPDNPDKKNRHRDALSFLRSKPFSDCIRAVKYNELSGSGKLKKFLLSYGLVSCFCLILNLRKSLSGRIPQ